MDWILCQSSDKSLLSWAQPIELVSLSWLRAVIGIVRFQERNNTIYSTQI
jgi:hypothetical protein